MIGAIALNRLWSLRRDRAALVLSFVVPVVFFSIFASIFGGASGRSATPRVHVIVVDEDGSENSGRFRAALRADGALQVEETRESAAPAERKPQPAGSSSTGAAFTAADAEAAVRAGGAPVALIIPKGFGTHPIRFGSGGDRPALTMLSDPSDPIAPEVLAGLVQKTAMSAMPDALARAGIEEVDRWSGGLTADQRMRLDESLSSRNRRSAPAAVPVTAVPEGFPAAGAGDAGTGLVEVKRRDVLGEKKSGGMVAFYAAGLGVMFLLFSAAGAGGALIEEAESGTLDRILSTRVTMTTLLAGKLVYLATLAVTQLSVMFIWGSIAFGLPMRGHWTGFAVMTVATALAASTFGLLLAALSRSRMQLVALSNLTVLAMSAVGGSMFPRFLMPEAVQKIGLLTLNAWAIDGFQKVFWRNEPVSHLWPQVSVLLGIAVVFFAVARRMARRWEQVA